MTRGRRRRGGFVGLAGALGLALLAATSARADAPPAAPIDMRAFDPIVASALGAYMTNPAAGRRPMLALGRGDLATLPPPVLLGIGDAQLRAGRPDAAAQAFQAVLAQSPPAMWTGYAEMGLGAVALAAGDFADAGGHYRRALAIGTGDLTVPRLVVALIDAASGAGAAALPALEAIAQDASQPPSQRSLAALMIAYARWWAGDEGAAGAFDAAAAVDPSGRFADDARYGAARARLASGDAAGALDALRALARERTATPEAGRPTPELVDLTPGAVLAGDPRAARARPIGAPADMLAASFDLNGPALARAALRRLRRGSAGDANPGPLVIGAVFEPGARGAPPGLRRLRTAGSTEARPGVRGDPRRDAATAGADQTAAGVPAPPAASDPRVASPAALVAPAGAVGHAGTARDGSAMPLVLAAAALVAVVLVVRYASP